MRHTRACVLNLARTVEMDKRVRAREYYRIFHCDVGNGRNNILNYGKSVRRTCILIARVRAKEKENDEEEEEEEENDRLRRGSPVCTSRTGPRKQIVS